MTAPLLSLDNISFAYEDGSMVLQSVSAQIYRGDFLALVGESGAGKSTLLQIIRGLISPSRGEVMLHVAAENKKAAMSMAFQVGSLILNRSALWNTLVGRISHTSSLRSYTGFFSKQDKDYCRRILRMIGLSDKEIDRPVRKLSGGQMQRIGLARAIAQDAPILLADEITANLDFKTSVHILEQLEEARNNLDLTILFATHDLQLAEKFCNRVLVLEKGRVIHDGSIKDMHFYDNKKDGRP